MKKNENENKLSLSKITVANLDITHMAVIKGGTNRTNETENANATLRTRDHVVCITG